MENNKLKITITRDNITKDLTLVSKLVIPIVEQMELAGRRHQAIEMLERLLPVYNSYDRVLSIIEEYIDLHILDE